MITTKEHASALKAALWEGKTIPFLAKTFKPRVSAATVGHVRAGLRWSWVPWPDGSTGALSRKRAAEIEKARKAAIDGVSL